MTVGLATDLLWLLTSIDLLFTGRGMLVEDVAHTLITTAEGSLCQSVRRIIASSSGATDRGRAP